MKKDSQKTSSQTVKKVIIRIKKYWVFLILSIIMATITVASSLYVPILVGNAIDYIIGPSNVNFRLIAQILAEIGVVMFSGNSVRTGRRHHQTRKLYRRMFRKHTGRCTPGRRHESKRCHRQTGRHPLWSKTNFLPGSAGKGIKRSSKYFDPIMIAIE